MYGPMIMDINVKDVLFGRDKICFNHVGNARFRLVISSHAEEYEHAPCRRDKSCIVYNVFNIVKAYEGRFLKRDGSGWKEVSDTEATQKVGHALRDKKQHEMRLRQKGVREQTKERSSNSGRSNIPIAKKPAFSKENCPAKKIKSTKKASAKKDSMKGLDFNSALMKLGEICSHEMEQLKTDDCQRSSDSENEDDMMSQPSQPATEKADIVDDSCASSILAMMGHLKGSDSNTGVSNTGEQAKSTTANSTWGSRECSSNNVCIKAQEPQGSSLGKLMDVVSPSSEHAGTLKTLSHRGVHQVETNIVNTSEHSRAVTPPSLEAKQLQAGWTYYPLAIPNYALQGGGAWKLRLVQVNGQEGGSIDLDPTAGFAGRTGYTGDGSTIHNQHM